MGATSPGGLSIKEFKLYATDVGQWIWGTAQGAFNEKQTLAQIITDAVIGMIPVVGDVTAVRDLIAVSTGLISNPEKREHTAEWVLLVILIFALIPVIGGVIKGVGRIALKVTGAAAKDSKLLAAVATDIIAFLNRIGHKNADAWFRALNVLKYEKQLVAKFRAFCDTVIVCIYRYGIRFKSVLPQSLIARMEQLSEGFRQLRILGDRMIPKALKDLHQRLETLRQAIHSGGAPRHAAVISAQTGRKTVSYAEEARLIESQAVKKIVRAGRYPQNYASAAPQAADKIRKVYRHQAGFPNVLGRVEANGNYYPYVAAAAGPIKNEMLEGEILFRAFGAGGSTHGVKVWQSNPIGPFWGRGAPPKTAAEWRELCAVLDEWNRNGWLSIMHIPAGVKIPACTSTVSEQFGRQLSGQFLPGGAKQAFVEAFYDPNIVAITNGLVKRGGGKATLPNGVIVEIRESGWHNVNGKTGYGATAIPGSGVVERLGVTERQSKVAAGTAQAGTKHERNN